jgi:hypothetical protein
MPCIKNDCHEKISPQDTLLDLCASDASTPLANIWVEDKQPTTALKGIVVRERGEESQVSWERLWNINQKCRQSS